MAFLLNVSTSQASPSWLDPVGIYTAEQSVGISQVSMDSYGTAVAVFVEGGTVRSSTKESGGSDWSEPVDISVPGPGQNVSDPQLAMNRVGDTVVAWFVQTADGDYIVQAAGREAGLKNWSQVVNLSDPDPLIFAVDPQVGIDDVGNAVAVWFQNDDNGASIKASTKPVDRNEWSQPINLSGEGRIIQEYPEVAVNSGGNAVAVWSESGAGGSIVKASSGQVDTNEWSQEADLGAGSVNDLPQVAINNAAAAVVVWKQFINNNTTIIQAATRPSLTGDWLAPTDLSDDTDKWQANNHRVAIDNLGNATAVWRQRQSNGGSFVKASSGRVDTNKWSQEATDLSGAGASNPNPQVSMSLGGDAVVVWEESLSIKASTKPVEAETWPEATDLSYSGQNASSPQVSMNEDGDAVATWKQLVNGISTIQSRGYDANAPRILSSVIPNLGIAGIPLGFSVVVRDTFDFRVGWFFGDGGSANGTSATHTYTKEGSYSVTAEVIDGAGNSVSTNGDITVSTQEETTEPQTTEPQTVQSRTDTQTSTESLRLSKVRLNARRFSLARLKAKGKKATKITVSFVLNAPAKVVATLMQKKTANRKGAAYRKFISVSRDVRGNNGKITFPRRVLSRLRKGNYIVKLEATTSSENKSNVTRLRLKVY